MMQKLKPCPYCKEIWLYASNGYYSAWRYDDAPTTARKMGGGIGSETVRNVVGLCLQIGLFDKDLFDRESILTSRGIQRRYAVAIQKRSCKTVDQKYWLLDEKESESLVVYAENAFSLPEHGHSLPEHGHSLHKDKQSKVKESKVKYIPPHTPPRRGAREKGKSSFDADDFFQAAVDAAYRKDK